ncbi:lysylphosphatidylglycerol synthase transmembrane domain-containing protein [Clostridium coskatii]|uniref:Phosphatidylglycerol lysyltransferase n=1 Tax=Clostridium coskatii TaxID=1705578 RepID=A0A162JHG3_9CLOT|nr:lysylphosphatidylglycerol synthase transmembrane domain-containing protein [Clostridium coskatii]OAA95125.1 hypothetical protein WX73_01534 [Clostridium coskatii]OBR97527.1 hypothetical protein CLCOS_02420 [Clostridium coskatii]
MKNKMFNIIVVFISACIFFLFFIFTKGIHSMIQELKSLDIHWISLAVIAVILFWTFETMILYTVMKKLYFGEHLLFKSIKFQMVGQFFGAITPLGAGSHPSQLYAMTEAGMPAGLSGSILIIKFMIHEIVSIFYLIVALLFRFNYFNSKIKYFIYFAILGIVINAGVMLLAISIVINKKMTKAIINFIVKLLGKVHIMKDVKSKQGKIEDEIESFHKNALLVRKHIGMCFHALIYSLFQWAFYFSIPYCIYRSFGLNSTDLWTIMAAQVFLTVFMTAIPLPGAEGGAEGGFYVIFNLFFKAKTVIALFVWRIITYYLSIIVSSIFILAFPNVRLKK